MKGEDKEMGPRVSCAERIKEGLRMSGMKQADLVEKTQIPKSTMSQYVNGKFKPKQDALTLIAKALNVDEGWLLGFDVPPGRTQKVEYANKEEAAVKELVEYLRNHPEKMAITSSLRDMTDEEIKELARYGEFIRAREGIK